MNYEVTRIRGRPAGVARSDLTTGIYVAIIENRRPEPMAALMRQVVIENPVINSAYAEPTRQFRFSDEGITDEVVDGRRISSYFVPIARPRKKG